MACLSFLKNAEYYINFDEGCVYCGNTIVAEINSPTYMRILEYLATNPKLWLSSDSIIDNCWPDRYAALSTFYSTISKLKSIHPEIDNSIDSKKGMGYRYLGQKREQYNVASVTSSTSPNVTPHVSNKSPGTLQSAHLAQKNDSLHAQVLFDPVAVRTATYYDLLQHGYTRETIGEALVQNDYQLYNIAPENEGTPAQWQEYLSSFPETFQYIVDKNSWHIVGNFSFVSVTQAQAAQILSGKFLEKDLNPAITRDLFSAGSDHILFLLNMSLNEEYGSVKNYTMLRNLFLEQIYRYAEDDIYFSSIITNVYRPNQEAFYKQWGFEFEIDHCYTGRIYSLKMYPYPEKLYQQLNSNSKLRDINERLKAKYDKQYLLLSADSKKQTNKR